MAGLRRRGSRHRPPVTLPWAHSLSRRFLPPAWRPRGRQHREEDKQPLIWAPQAASLFPSTAALTAPGTAARPRHRWAEHGQPVAPRAASCRGIRQGWGQRPGSPLAGQGCQRRGCGAAVPVGHCLSLGKAAGSSIMSASDKGAQLGRRGDQIRALLFLYSRKGKKKLKGRKKENPLYVFPTGTLPCFGATEIREQG